MTNTAHENTNGGTIPTIPSSAVETQNYRVYHNDNFANVSDGTVDLVLTDPPFNISKKTNFHTYEKNTIHSYKFDDNADAEWDTYTHDDFLDLIDNWCAEWNRVLRKGGSFAIFCADAYISHFLEALKKNGLSPKRIISWRKNNAVPVNRAYLPMSAVEYVIVGVKDGKNKVFNADVNLVEQSIDDNIIESVLVADKVSTIVNSHVLSAVRENGTLMSSADSTEHVNYVVEIVSQAVEGAVKEVSEKVRSMYKVNTDGEQYLQGCVPNYVQNPLKTGHRIHPTEKPVPLLQYFVSLYSNPGDVVLDGFGGSGSSGEAALSLGRKTVIVEREKEFYDKIVPRLESTSTVGSDSGNRSGSSAAGAKRKSKDSPPTVKSEPRNLFSGFLD